MENTNIVDRGLIFQERFKELVGSSTQEEVAKKVNTSRQNVGNWLKGKSRPDIFALSEISKGFGVSTDYLLGLTDVKSTDTTVKGVCEYTGLSEEAVERLQHFHAGAKSACYELNYLITSSTIFEISIFLRILQLESSTIIKYKDMINEENFFEIDRECDLSRYKLSELLIKLMDKFDDREKLQKEYKNLQEKFYSQKKFYSKDNRNKTVAFD